ncbi:ATP-dependent helicase [Corynebacterium atypicum]|uniref:ATP-dependent helicase n=1 Tax=Corynebacterium atypicum TaxID=191610 RepID=A0ABN4DCS0_9CORY|nr:ATP-dependent RNA helicase HrpA [Corynebacterium atypicum]AIG64018.1 ATP-dependent helicase [Corynebacterium atypicum]
MDTSDSTRRQATGRSDAGPTRADLFSRLDELTLIDARKFQRRLKKARSPQALVAIAGELDAAAQRVRDVDSRIPEITFPENLPVTASHDDIAAAINEHQVVVIAGETGSGKTTQIPKICLELGRGRRGMIGHTQPRRLAARTVAERIAQELGQKVGASVGYAIRFDDHVGAATAVKLMTDGILLAEMQRDRWLNAYDTIIIDEAHERSLNIDFLLGYLKRLLPRRPDLKVIITSATIDPQRFAAHFADAAGNPAPVLEVSGRTYPVEIRYRPLDEEVDGKLVSTDQVDGVIAACRELMAEGPGDILCFFPSERDIRDCQAAIEKQAWRSVEVTPLFGRLSNQEQHRVFAPHSSRRIVLATNIAETSLTVPGIRYVVDTGTARISRYSTRTKVQRLPIEPISQASANQRSGRCGRVAEGIAIRLYSEEDFLSRAEFTDPEILRTNLASVILQMALLRLGDIAEFPFVEPPEPKAIRDGILLLHELGAISDRERDGLPQLTRLGRDLARIPVDPRLARMLVEAHRLGCLSEVIVIVAALSIRDIHERPLDHQARADQLHARFKDKTSDFLSYLKLWDYIEDKRAELSGAGLRRLMKEEFLHFMRSREWRDLIRQLRDLTADLGWQKNTVVGKRDADAIHRSLLTGLLQHIGARIGTSREFQGTRGTKFMIFPGSALAKKPPEFVMAAEVVETSAMWARDVARIDPAWVEKAAPGLVKYQYSEPYWSPKKAAAMVHEKASLYGVPVVADRTVPLHKVDQDAARQMFIRHALVDGEWNTHQKFFTENQEKLTQASEVEERARRRGLVVDSDTLFEFYDARVPATATTGAHFNSWWKKKRRQDPTFLDFQPEKLLTEAAEAVRAEDFPETITIDGIELGLSYRFEPGADDDGVTVLIPVPMLASVNPRSCQWLVPGLREELFTELLRTLPKALRRTVVPAPAFAAKAAPTVDPARGTVTEELARALGELGARGIDADDFAPERLPNYLRPTFGAVDKRGTVIDHDKSLRELQRRQRSYIRSSVSKLGRTGEKAAVTQWTAENLGTIDTEIQTTVDGHVVSAYPALEVSKHGVGVKVHATRAAADQAMLTATLQMLMTRLRVNDREMTRGLPLKQRVGVDHFPYGGAAGLVEQARVAGIRDLLLAHGGPVREPGAFEELARTVGEQLPGTVRRSVVTLAPALVSYLEVVEELARWEGEAIDDLREQLAFLMPKQVVIVHAMSHLKHLPRYFQAMLIRLSEMGVDPDRDAYRQDEVSAVKDQLTEAVRRYGEAAWRDRRVKEIQWLIQEFRVSLFAQRLGTAGSVSRRKIERAIAKL